jgi:hypothetical protein
MKELIEHWLETKQRLDTIKTIEADLRRQITQELLADKAEGSVTKIIDGYKLQATAVLNYSLDEDAYQAYKYHMSKEELNCFRQKVELIRANLRKMDNDSVVHRIVTVTPGMPQLALKGGGVVDD